MKKVLTIFLALFMVLSLSGVVMAEDATVIYKGGEEGWVVSIGPSSIFNLTDGSVNGSVTVSGLWSPYTTLYVTTLPELTMTNDDGKGATYDVAVAFTPISQIGSYTQESTATGSFTIDPSNKMKEEVKLGEWSGALTFTIETKEDVVVETPGTLEELQAAFAAAAAQNTGNIVINLEQDFDVAGHWTAVNPTGYNGAHDLIVNGNGYTIKNLNEVLFVGSFGGFGSITINDLTIDNAHIVSTGYNGMGVGAFVAYSDASGSISLNNCNLTNSNVTCTGEYAGGLVGYSSSNISIKNCTVEGSTITSGKSAGGIIGQDANAGRMNGITVTNCNIVSTGSDGGEKYMGTIVGTSNAAASVYTKIVSTNCQIDGTGVADNSNYYGRAFVGLSINGTKYV